jgi:hypothetical protein
MVVESADTADLKFAARKGVRVRLPAIPKSIVVLSGGVRRSRRTILQAWCESPPDGDGVGFEVCVGPAKAEAFCPSGSSVYGKGHGREGSGGSMFASSNIRVMLSIYFQLPPTEKISGNCTLELRL